MRVRPSKVPRGSKTAARSGDAKRHAGKPLPPFEVSAELGLATQDLRLTMANSQNALAPLLRTFRRSIDPFLDTTFGASRTHFGTMTHNSRLLGDVWQNRSDPMPGVSAHMAPAPDLGTNTLAELVAPYMPRDNVELTMENLRMSFCLKGETITAGVRVPLERLSTGTFCSSGPPNWTGGPKGSSVVEPKRHRSSTTKNEMRLRILVERWYDMVVMPSLSTGEEPCEDPEELHEGVMLVLQKEEEAVQLMLELERHRLVRDRARIRAVRREQDLKSCAASVTPGGRLWALPNSWSTTRGPAVSPSKQVLAPLPEKKDLRSAVRDCDARAAKELRGLLQSTAKHCGGVAKGYSGARRRLTLLSDGTVTNFNAAEGTVCSGVCDNWAEYVLCEGDFAQFYEVTQQLVERFSSCKLHSNARTKFLNEIKRLVYERRTALSLSLLPQAIAVLSTLPLALLPVRLHFARSSTSSVPSCTVSVDAVHLATANDSSFFTSHHATGRSLDMDLCQMLLVASNNGVLTGDLPRAGEVLIGVEIDAAAIVRQSQCRTLAMKSIANVDALAAHHRILVRAAFESCGHGANYVSPSVDPLHTPISFAPLPPHRDHYTVDVWRLYITATAALTESHDTILPCLNLLRAQYARVVGSMYAASDESAKFAAAKALWHLEAAYSARLAELHRNECAVMLYAEHVVPYAAFLRSDTALWGPVYLRSLRVAYAFCAVVAELGTDAIPPHYRPLLRPVLRFVECLGGQRELRQCVEKFLLELEERGKRVRMPLVRWDVARQHRAELDAAAAAVAEKVCSAEDVIACLAAPSDVLATPPPPLSALKVRYTDVPPLSALTERR